MFTRSRIVGLVALLVLALPALAFFSYVLPHQDVVRIVGTEVRRIDMDKNPATPPNDVYYINAEDPETKETYVYTNEDTRWGFPWYFKFNSADLQAQAQSIAGERGTAIVKSYGWRIHLFSWFPNATKITRADADATPLPIFNIVFFLTLGLVGFLIWRGVRRLRGPRRGVENLNGTLEG